MSDTRFFPRGTGPLVSFLLATRKRVDMVKVAVASIFDNAKCPDQIEIIFKIDDDDQESINFYNDLKSKGRNVTGIIGPRGLGYKQMHVWVNQMAQIAKGDWQLIMNDDMRFIQKDWDEVLLNANFPSPLWHQCPDVCGLLCHTDGRPDATEFMFVRRKIIELLGHWSLNVHSDNWISSVLGFMGCMFASGVHVEHLSNTFEDEVRKAALAVYPISGKDLNQPAQMSAKLEDIMKLTKYIKQYNENKKVA
ncbi:hypothetical protein C4577_01820 [Candidatus Parcubacteria bacterium]|nr:MAG: hypothetical protein C4577_01820 [Candidatus Parcubacteria bacterium]